MCKAWNILCSIQTTFWLLTVLSFFLFCGFIYTNIFFSFYNTLDYSPIIQWLQNTIMTDFYRIWWVIGICITISAIMCNMFFCTIDKLLTIVKNRPAFTYKQLMGKYYIAAVHLASILILLSHFISQKYNNATLIDIEPGNSVYLDYQKLYIQSIQVTYFPDESLLKNLINNVSVTLSNNGIPKKEIIISALHPTSHNGFMLFLIKNNKKTRKISKEIKHSSTTSSVLSQYSLQIKNDYGYSIWFFSFLCIIVLMSIFYISTANGLHKK